MLTALVVATALINSHDLVQPKAPTDLRSWQKMEKYLRDVGKYEQALKKKGLFDEEKEEWVHEQFEFFGMRTHMLRMRAGEDGKVDPFQYQKAIQHKKDMPPPVDPTYIGTTWAFLGPRALDGTSSVLDGPVTGRVNTVAYDPADNNVWWVGGATGGVFKTTDNGSTFTNYSDRWDYLYTSKIAIDPTNSNRVYVATGDYPGWWGYGMGLMRTSNGGTSWTNELRTELQGCEISDIVVDPDNPAVVIVTAGRGTNNSNGAGIWRSTDYGNTWTRVRSDLMGNGFARLSVGIRSGGDRWFYAGHGSSGLVLRSNDDGATWSFAGPNAIGLVAVAASKTDRDVVYCYTSDHQVLKSTDNGDNWTSIRGNLGNITAAGADFRQETYNYLFDCINTTSDGSGNDVLLAGFVDLFALVNPQGNTTWQWINGQPNQTRNVHADYHAFAQSGSVKSAALIGNDGGVWQLTYVSLIGFVWSNKNSALRLTEHVFTSPHPDATNNPTFALTGMWHLGCGYSLGNVNTWTSNYGGDGMWTAVDDTNPAIEFVSSQNLGAGGTIDLRGTSNYWVTYSNLSTTTSLANENWAFAGPWSEIPGDSGALYMAGERLYKLKWTGGAATWTKSIGNADFSMASDEYATAVRGVNAGGCFVGTNYGRLYGSLGPATGMPLIHDFSGGISSIESSPTDPDDLLVSIGGVDTGPNYQGALWEILDATSVSPTFVDRSGSGANSLPGIGVNWIVRDPNDPLFTWYAATDLGVFYTRDRGANWYNATEPLGLPNALVYQLEISDNYLYASTFGRGIWRMQLYTGAPTLTGFTFQNVEVTGGNSTPATMTLSRPAPPGGLQIPVTSNNLAAIPTQLVNFPAGVSSATVYVKTNVVTADSNVTATANYGGPQSDSIIVRECTVTDMTLQNVTAGDSFVGIVYIDRPAPAGGIDIDLVSNDPGGTQVQTPVTILPGAQAAFFNVSTVMIPITQVVSIQASGPGSGVQKSFTKYGVYMVSATIGPDPVWNTQGSSIMVLLNRPAPTSGFQLAIDSGLPAVATAPATATIPGGQSSISIPITTFYVANDTTAGFRVWEPYQDYIEDTLLVKHLGIASVTVGPNPVVGGNSIGGAVTVDHNVGSSSVVLSLTSDNPSLVNVPSQLVILPNTQSAAYVGATAAVSSITDVGITGQIGTQHVSGAYSTVNLRLLPATIVVVPSSFTVNLGRVNAGNVASLQADDGNVLQVCKFIVPNLTVAPIDVRLDAVAPVTACTGLTFRLKSRMTNSGLFSQTMDVWNWTTNAYDTTVARTDVTGTTFATRDLVATGSMANFLRSSDGALRARYRVRQTGPSATINWCNEVDYAAWLVTP